LLWAWRGEPLNYIGLNTACDLINAFNTVAWVILFLNIDYLENKMSESW
jgi:hypothetical protein